MHDILIPNMNYSIKITNWFSIPREFCSHSHETLFFHVSMRIISNLVYNAVNTCFLSSINGSINWKFIFFVLVCFYFYTLCLLVNCNIIFCLILSIVHTIFSRMSIYILFCIILLLQTFLI